MPEPGSPFLFTSESVTEGHPDKLCDAVADAILDDVLEHDRHRPRAAVEVATTTGLVFVLGELTTDHWVDIQEVVRRTVREIGYDDARLGFDWETCGAIVAIKEQSPDIARGVDHALESRDGTDADELGAGDQGMMFGYASDETAALMPMPIQLAHGICRRLAEVRRAGTIPLRPDGKSQVTVEYDASGTPLRVHTVLVSTQHDPDIGPDELRDAVIATVVRGAIPAELLDERTRYLVNPTGRFVIGGPMGDSGLSGRKIIVDTYGGMARHGGGSFSGKDPTKVDRSAAYMARYVAKHVVAAGLARRCELQLAYAIGVAHPLAVNVDTFGTGAIPDHRIADLVQRHFDLRPGSIIEELDLFRPIYRQTAAYGHFGREDLDLPWERTPKADLLRAEAGAIA
ncbi:MAG: methionine adenosyltransferase [Chloroflexota bacterium]|nr:methionine adenosyltransferase [Chloroflexota bacterium]